MRLIIALLFTFMVVSCERYDVRFNVRNDSKDTIYISVGSTDDIASSVEINHDIKEEKDGFTDLVKPGEVVLLRQYGGDFWDTFIEHADKEKLRLFVITQKDFDANSWEQISNKKLYHKVGEYSLSDMESLKWLVTIE